MSEDYLEKLYKIVDQKRGTYLDFLKEAVSIRSVAGDQPETKRVISWAESRLRDLGAATTLQDVGAIIVEGKKITLPPVLIGDIKSETSKVTLLVYGHLDVRPTRGSKGSIVSTEEYNLIEEDGVLFGKGVTDSKGPLLCWFNAIEAFRELGVDLPVNLRFVIEAMKESGSFGLLEYMSNNRGHLFRNVSYICISDSSCLFTTKPVITFGGRGCCRFTITVEGGKSDLHSGVHGGMVSEPMTDLVSLLCNLTNNKGEILVPNFRDNVEDVTPDEEKAYHKLSFDVGSFKSSTGVEKLLHKEDKKRLLMHRSRFPSLSIHKIDTGNSEDDAIPSKVTASFTIRIVPNQTPQEVFHKVQVYLMYIFNKSQSPNRVTIQMPVAIPPWIANPKDVNYKSASKAIQRVYKQDPELIREGSSIPIVSELQTISGKSVLLLPVGSSSHSILKNRDRMDVKTFMDGTKVAATYMYELSLQKKAK